MDNKKFLPAANIKQVNFEKEDDTEIYINNLMILFLEKYHHLDNEKNKEIIYKLCDMLVKQMPEHKNNKLFYINFLESTIKDISNPKVGDVINDDK